jgi:hypothetical protein
VCAPSHADRLPSRQSTGGAANAHTASGPLIALSVSAGDFSSFYFAPTAASPTHAESCTFCTWRAKYCKKKTERVRENGESQLSEQLWLICIKQRGSRNYWRAGRAIGMHTGGWLAGWRLVIKASLKHAPAELIHLFISSHWHSGHATLRPDKSY